MKKKYIAPDFEVIKMELGNAILAMSQSNQTGTEIGQVPDKVQEDSGSGGGDFWDVD